MYRIIGKDDTGNPIFISIIYDLLVQAQAKVNSLYSNYKYKIAEIHKLYTPAQIKNSRSTTYNIIVVQSENEQELTNYLIYEKLDKESAINLYEELGSCRKEITLMVNSFEFPKHRANIE